MTEKQLNIKNRTYYFYNDLINTLNFETNDLKLDKKTWKDIDIYYIGYVDKNKPDDWKINNVNLLYLMFNKVFCIVGEEKGVKYLKIEKSHRDPVLNPVLILLNIKFKKLVMKNVILMMVLTKLNLLVMVL